LFTASADETVRYGEHFAIAARALLAPLFHAAALSGGVIDRARVWLGRLEFSEPAEILRGADAEIALEELSGVSVGGSRLAPVAVREHLRQVGLPSGSARSRSGSSAHSGGKHAGLLG
jgi:hypothetical protein